MCIFAVPVLSSQDHADNTFYDSPIGCVVCKIDRGRGKTHDPTDERSGHVTLSGYMGMLAVNKNYRRLGIGTALLKRVIRRMRDKGCISVSKSID